ncbi:TonB-dependent receptor [Spirosoma endbachense]|uniref:TonB-dependent receptor n=2 Tax=Spirosoma endbachense TaxID=2666025 RepID=A0A6P1VNA4_9BACT|nr:TonB-dependent receptor [Spirosoma endbachense]
MEIVHAQIMKTFVILTGFLSACFTSFGQLGELKGRVTDGNQKPVEYATALVLSAADSSMVKGGLTDTTGRFAINSLPLGAYRLRITALGFASFTSQFIMVSSHESVMDVGSIRLTAESKNLGEIIVKGERPVVEQSMGKLVLNVTNSFFKTATNALDVLRRAPGLLVNQDGAISVKGQYTPVVYIDGKQLPLTADELRGLAASDIDQVEVITNASAQFDGETRAVINIKLKRDKALGWKGSLYSGYRQNQRYTGGEVGGSATYKTKQWAYYGRVGYSLSNDYLLGLGRRVVQSSTGRTEFNNDQLYKWTSKPLTYQFSADLTANASHQFGVLVKGNATASTDQLTNLNQQTDYANERVNTVLLQTLNVNQSRNQSVAIDLNYKGKLNERGDELTVFLDYASYNTQKGQDFRNDYRSFEGIAQRSPMVMRGQFPSTIRIRSFRADYSHPFGKMGKFEAGTKLTWTTTDSDLRYDTLAAEGFVFDPSRSNHFLYDEKITAAYAQLSQEWGNTQLQAGLRVENTRSVGNSLTLNNSVDRSYFRWLPSVKVQQKLSETDMVSAGFSRKMRRPAFWELNPFTLYVDPYMYTEGNPFLLPVTNNTLDLTYTHRDVTFSLNYTLDKDVFVQLPIQDDQTKIVRYTRVNLDTQRRAWFDVAVTHALTKWWKTQHYAQLQYAQTQSAYPTGGLINTQAWSYYLDGRHTFTLGKGYNLDLSYYYSSPSASYIYTVASNGTLSLGLQKSVLKGRGNLQINANDLLNTYRELFYGQFANLDVWTLQKRNSRQLTLRFTYTFGRSTFNRNNRNSGSAEEEGRAR